MEKNKKALQYHSICIHWAVSGPMMVWNPSTPTQLNVYRTANRMKAFFFFFLNEGGQRNVAKLHFVHSQRQCGSFPPDSPTKTRRCTMLSYEDRAQRGLHRKSSLTNNNFYQMETIIACKNNSYKGSIKESVKDNFVFFCLDKCYPPPPYTIFIKVHLSAVSLPRKQLSIENSACFLFVLFVCLWSGFCAPVVTVCRLTCPSCWKGAGAETPGCWLSA